MPDASISSAMIYQKNADGAEYDYEVPVNQDSDDVKCNGSIEGGSHSLHGRLTETTGFNP